MTVTNKLELVKIKDEIVNFLRVNITDPKSRGTTTSSLLSGNGILKDFNINASTVKAIINVEHPVSNVLTFGTDYTYNTDYDNSGTKNLRISFIAAPVNGTSNIEVNYKTGETWIYPDYPQPQSTLSDFPRIAVDVINGTSTDESLDGAHKNTVLTISVTVYDYKAERLDGLIDEVREELLNNQKGFYYTDYISASNLSPTIYVPGTNNKVLQKTIDFDSLWNFEVVS